MICAKCGYEWVHRTELPKSCPNCKSYTWNISIDDKEVQNGKDN